MLLHSKRWLFFTLVGLVTGGSMLNLNDPCTNPVGEVGHCIKLSECKSLSVNVTESEASRAVRELFRQSRCGVQNKDELVCCIIPGSTSKNATLPRTPHCGNNVDNLILIPAVKLDDFGWTVLLMYKNVGESVGFYCEGSLINSRYVLTAAHCINSRRSKLVGVRLGEYDLSNEGPDCDQNGCADAPVDVDIEKIIIHPEFSKGRHAINNDIALIRLARDVPFSNFIRPICLPIDSSERNITGGGAITTGWSDDTSVKRRHDLVIMDTEQCNTLLEPLRLNHNGTYLCAKGSDRNHCRDSSGSSLIKRIESRYFLYGIASLGRNGCGGDNEVIAYTIVSKYIDWIESQLE
ncbi:CLIP domain-containing serine protease B4-like [Toxorhynchites rutilus septentrionalis]|uniref:CLIP domain-containing serine protease B4-like n=1 Tax=Toxorhynchites rutilus septentrionalis TaxID=329112 RepID=UPI0024790220|nr:CLIP domain-containing serine protease B4-like [Toxorhynchites rutilus septentrionalis]